MRVFAGPNGSGKSTIFNQINAKFDVGLYINADEIEKELTSKKIFDLKSFGIDEIKKKDFDNYLQSHSLSKKAIDEGMPIQLNYENGQLLIPSEYTNSYEAAFIADLIRNQLIKKGRKFAFETVMSHESKLDILDLSLSKGYKNYLYFICTESPKINIDRVRLRVQQGGHNVDEFRIEGRYYETLRNLRKAVTKTYRAFLWDNSGLTPQLILEVLEGKDVTFHYDSIPHWVNEYLL